MTLVQATCHKWITPTVIIIRLSLCLPSLATFHGSSVGITICYYCCRLCNYLARNGMATSEFGFLRGREKGDINTASQITSGRIRVWFCEWFWHLEQEPDGSVLIPYESKWNTRVNLCGDHGNPARLELRLASANIGWFDFSIYQNRQLPPSPFALLVYKKLDMRMIEVEYWPSRPTGVYETVSLIKQRL